MSDYEIPAANPGQVAPKEPERLTQATHPDLKNALDTIHSIVKRHPGVKVLAADDKKWVRVGWRLEYPNGEVDWLCVRAKDAKRTCFRYEALRAALAYRLEHGEAPDVAMDAVEEIYEGQLKRQPSFDGTPFAALERLKAVIADRREKDAKRASGS